MYFRRKTSAGRVYLQIVESRRQGNQVRQQVIATLGRYDELRDSGQPTACYARARDLPRRQSSLMQCVVARRMWWRCAAIRSGLGVRASVAANRLPRRYRDAARERSMRSPWNARCS